MGMAMGGGNNGQVREASGNVSYDDRLVSFLYELMRDHVTPGAVERVLAASHPGETTYSNGWLARYADYVATELRRAGR